MYSLPVRRLKEILSHVVPGSTLGPVEEVKSPQLPRLYILNMSDDRRLLLSFAPSLAVRLLRHEATIMASEAILVSFLGESTRRPGTIGSPRNQTDARPRDTGFSGLVPKLLKHSSNNREMAYPYSIFEPTTGTPLSTLNPQLSIPDRCLIDKEVGHMARALASLTSPTGTFGMVSRVIPDPFIAHSSTAPKPVGSKTWSEAFNTLLEAILRDGEDMAVLLPYEGIRAHFQRMSWRLDAITSPRLVILDINSETNVMVERVSHDIASKDSTESVRLTGLRNWSQGIFGDPLIANCFDDPSEGFLEGWREGGEEVIEDEENKEARLLLYRCYRAIVSIVTEYYRPKGDSSKRELDGRRTLTSTLAGLDKMHNDIDEELKRVRSVSTDTGDPKRQKLDEE